MARKTAPAAERWVLVTTELRGVFYGRLVTLGEDSKAHLADARCAIYWGTTRGVFELAEVGPNSKSKIGAKVDSLLLTKVSAVADVSEVARAAWEAVA